VKGAVLAEQGIGIEKSWRFEAGRGRTKLHCRALMIGEDLTVLIEGGEAHVGSVAIGLPRPSLRSPDRLSATTSIFNVVGHKDDALSRPLADDLSAATDRTVVVVAGCHLPEITPTEIEEVLENLKAVSRRLLEIIPVRGRPVPSEG
jgi:hypothetical protein